MNCTTFIWFVLETTSIAVTSARKQVFVPTPGLLARASPALVRRARLLWLRLRFRRASFGNGCDIRQCLHCAIGAAGSVVGAQCVLDRSMTIECHGVLDIGSRVIFGHYLLWPLSSLCKSEMTA